MSEATINIITDREPKLPYGVRLGKEAVFEKVLLVEGILDAYLLKRLCERLFIENVDIFQMNGFSEKQLTSLIEEKITVRPNEIKKIGIVVDADDNPESRFQQIQTIRAPYKLWIICRCVW
jgi:hypothetical protein